MNQPLAVLVPGSGEWLERRSGQYRHPCWPRPGQFLCGDRDRAQMKCLEKRLHPEDLFGTGIGNSSSFTVEGNAVPNGIGYVLDEV